MVKERKGITGMIERSDYATNFIREGHSYTHVSQRLSRHFGVNMENGVLYHYFKIHPEEREIWERARKKRKDSVVREEIKESDRIRSLEQKVLRQMLELARKDVSFRDTLVYYKTCKKSQVDPESVYSIFCEMHNGKYPAQIVRELGVSARLVFSCRDACEIKLPNGRKEYWNR